MLVHKQGIEKIDMKVMIFKRKEKHEDDMNVDSRQSNMLQNISQYRYNHSTLKIEQENDVMMTSFFCSIFSVE